MRSRTSRGVPEWSGGKELYIGSAILAIGTSFGVIGIVPGPPEGSRGSTGGVHLPRGATWAVGGAHWPIWAKGTSPKRPMRQERKKMGESYKGKAPPRCLGEDGLLPTLGRTLPWRKGQGLRLPLSLGPIYSGEKEEQTNPKAWRLPLPPVTHLPPPAALSEALLESRYFHHAVVLLDLHQPLPLPCWIKAWETSPFRTCVERGGAVRSALGSSVI